jgi:hypothetical protein
MNAASLLVTKREDERNMKKLSIMFALFALASLVAFGADISGKWTGEGAGGRGGPQTFTFKADGAKLTGTVEGGRGGPAEISNGKIDGDKVSFTVVRDMGEKGKFTTNYKGTVSGDSIKMTVEREGGKGPTEMTLKKAGT